MTTCSVQGKVTFKTKLSTVKRITLLHRQIRVENSYTIIETQDFSPTYHRKKSVMLHHCLLTRR